MDSRSDEDLMAAIGQGDQRAFALLVDRHGKRATALAARITLNRSDAEEVVQEAFLRVWVKAPAWRPQAGAGDAQFQTWFRRVLVNLCIDWRRRPVSEDIEKVPELTILAEAEGDAGVYAIANLKKRQFFITGHAEYDGHLFGPF